jgi:coenzyme F420-reducing hydrogenase delta subunit
MYQFYEINSFIGQHMSNLGLEFAAVRLEQNMIEHYKRLKFERVPEGMEFDDYQNALNQELKQALMSYFDDWRILMVACGGQHKFSFWVDAFYRAYSSVLLETGTPYFTMEGATTASHYNDQASAHIDKILKRLNKLFKSASFLEQLQQYNQYYTKQIAKIRESYCTVSEIYPNAVDLKFELSLEGLHNQWVDISAWSKLLYHFQKQLKQLSWYNAQAVFTFYQVIRVDQRYVVKFFLTLDPLLCVEPSAYSREIDICWKRVTQNRGISFCPLLDFQQYQHEDEYQLIIQRNALDQALDPLSALDEMPDRETSSEGLANRICVYPKGFKWFHGAPVRR